METAIDRDTLLRRLAETIAGDAALLKANWTHLVLVSVMESGTPDMTGFCYAGGSSTSVSPSNFAVFDVLLQLRAAMAKADGKAPWVAALFRIERASGKFSAQFEYDKPERWAVTPENVKQRARELMSA